MLYKRQMECRPCEEKRSPRCYGCGGAVFLDSHHATLFTQLFATDEEPEREVRVHRECVGISLLKGQGLVYEKSMLGENALESK